MSFEHMPSNCNVARHGFIHRSLLDSLPPNSGRYSAGLCSCISSWVSYKSLHSLRVGYPMFGDTCTYIWCTPAYGGCWVSIYRRAPSYGDAWANVRVPQIQGEASPCIDWRFRSDTAPFSRQATSCFQAFGFLSMLGFSLWALTGVYRERERCMYIYIS